MVPEIDMGDKVALSEVLTAVPGQAAACTATLLSDNESFEGYLRDSGGGVGGSA